MDQTTLNEIINGVGGIGLLIGAILFIEWIFLPFAIFGIKGKLNDIRDGIALTNAPLEEIANRGKEDSTDPKSP